jgi:type VI secretion system secreted protein VgrG
MLQGLSSSALLMPGQELKVPDADAPEVFRRGL